LPVPTQAWAVNWGKWSPTVSMGGLLGALEWTRWIT